MGAKKQRIQVRHTKHNKESQTEALFAQPGEMKLCDLLKGFAEYNPRTISDDAFASLKVSIERFKLVEPPVFNTRTGRIVGGHQRLTVMSNIVKDHNVVIPVMLVDLPETEEKALNLTLNNPNAQGMFDTEQLKEILDELGSKLEEVEFDALGLSELSVSFLPDEWVRLGDPGNNTVTGTKEAEQKTSAAPTEQTIEDGATSMIITLPNVLYTEFSEWWNSLGDSDLQRAKFCVSQA